MWLRGARRKWARSRNGEAFLGAESEEHPARRKFMLAGAARQRGPVPCWVAPPLNHPNLSFAASPATVVVPVFDGPATRSRLGNRRAKRAANLIVSSRESGRKSS